MPTNTAAWLKTIGSPLVVGPAPYPVPGPNQIVVKNRAVAINPVDWLMQSIGDVMFPWVKYPFIIGSDVAGEVVEVGPGVTRFKVGDRVFGHALAISRSSANAAEGAFQHYTLLKSQVTAPIPEGMAFETAAVMPLGVSTAASGLFQTDYLGLAPPQAAPQPTGKTLLVWGGSTSVGANAIQLATAAGYEVVTTASPRNFDYVKSLGATAAFDYKSPTVTRDLIKAFAGRTIAGALAIGFGSGPACLRVVHAAKGDKFVALASAAAKFDHAPTGFRRTLWLVPRAARMIASTSLLMTQARIWGVGVKFIFGSSLADNAVSSLVYEAFLPRALAEGRYRAVPSPRVVARGLEGVEAGLAAQKAGVSATKIVVSL